MEAGLEVATEEVRGLEEFLRAFPLMAVRPVPEYLVTLVGEFEFVAQYNSETVQDTYELMICVPFGFPRAVPSVLELGGRIPRLASFHMNSDGTLCLGSPLRLLECLSRSESVYGFTLDCLIPYLFAISKRLRQGSEFIFGELAHGAEGVLNDYRGLFGLTEKGDVLAASSALTMKKRLANKKPCPCGCQRRLGRCAFNAKIRAFRAKASRAWFKMHYHELLRQTQSGSQLGRR
jgi:hypothetical protein